MFGHLPDFFFVDRTSNIGHHCGTGIVRSLFRASEVVVIYPWTKEERKYRAFSILLGGSGSRYTLTSKCYTKNYVIKVFPVFDCSLESGISSSLYAVLIANFCDWSGCDDQIPLSTAHSSLRTDFLCKYLKQTSFTREECLIFKVEKGI